MREVIATDIPVIVKLLRDALQISGYKDVERLGGLTNHTYRVVVEENSVYAVRLPGKGTEVLINRSNERISTQLACELGIDAQLLYFGPSGEKITKYINGAQTLSAESFNNPEILRKTAEVLHALHTSRIDTKVPFDVFEMASGYEKIIRDNSVKLFDGYEAMKAQILKIRKRVTGDNVEPVPCHNDPLCENWILGENGKLYLIDWEYAGMNDGMWDLADVSIEANLCPKQDMSLLRFYFERDVKHEELVRFHANKLYLDFLWSLWGKARVPFDGEEMEKYGQKRYDRLKKNTDAFLRDFPIV